MKIPFHPATKGLGKIYKNVGFKVVHGSNNNIRSLLGNPKDKLKTLEKSGIYEIQCSHCDSKYIGQTRRNFGIRFKEHIAHFRFNRFEKSSVAQHIYETGHSIKETDLKIVKALSSTKELNCFESMSIFKNQGNHLLNRDDGPIPK